MSENNKKNTKKLKKILIPIAVIILVLFSALMIIRANSTAIVTKAMYSLMPESYVAETQDGEVEYFVEYSKTFNPKTDGENALNAFEYYCYDENGNKVELGPDATFINDSGNEISLDMMFSSSMGEKISKIQKVFSVVVKVFFVVLFVGLIVLWFFKWSKKQDLEKEMKYGSNKQNNTKKRRKK